MLPFLPTKLPDIRDNMNITFMAFWCRHTPVVPDKVQEGRKTVVGVWVWYEYNIVPYNAISKQTLLWTVTTILTTLVKKHHSDKYPLYFNDHSLLCVVSYCQLLKQCAYILQRLCLSSIQSFIIMHCNLLALCHKILMAIPAAVLDHCLHAENARVKCSVCISFCWGSYLAC